MNLPDHIHPIAVDEALLNIGMTINEIRSLTGNTAPQVIRTPAELQALDPHTLLSTMSGGDGGGLARSAEHILACYGTALLHDPDQWPLPAVVVASGEHVRACREALEGGTE